MFFQKTGATVLLSLLCWLIAPDESALGQFSPTVRPTTSPTGFSISSSSQKAEDLLDEISKPVAENTIPNTPAAEAAARKKSDLFYTLEELLASTTVASPSQAAELITRCSQKEIVRADEQLAEIFASHLIIAKILSLIESQDQWPDWTSLTTVEELPDSFANAPPDLKLAWREGAYLASVRPTPNVDEMSASGSFFDEKLKFYRLILDALADGDWTQSKTVTEFTWGEPCWTGSGDFRFYLQAFSGLATLHQGEESKALAIIFGIWLDQPMNFYRGKIFAEMSRQNRFINWFNESSFDWERAAVGYLMNTGSSACANRLSQLGRDRSLRLLAEAATIPGHSLPPDELVEIMERIASRKESSGPLLFADEPGTLSVKEESIDLFLDSLPQLLPNVESDRILEALIQSLDGHSFEKVQPILQPLASHPIPKISRLALNRLHDHGIWLDRSPTPTQTFSLPLKVGGKPYRSRPLELTQGLPSKNQPSASFSTTEKVSTGPDGILEFSRSETAHLSDERAYVILCNSGEKLNSLEPIKIESDFTVLCVARHFSEIRSPEQGNWDVPTHELSIEFDLPESRSQKTRENPGPTQLLISVMPLNQSKDGPFRRAKEVRFLLESDHGQPIRLPNLGEGVYQFAAWVHGCQPWECEPLILTRDMSVRVTPNPGFHLRFHLDTPQPEYFSVSTIPSDRQEERQDSLIPFGFIFLRPSGLDHLAPGKYQLVIFSSVYQTLTPVEQDFTIDADSPATVDLGTIPVPKKE